MGTEMKNVKRAKGRVSCKRHRLRAEMVTPSQLEGANLPLLFISWEGAVPGPGPSPL